MCYPLFSQRPGIGTCGLSLVIQCCSMWRVRWLWRARPGGPASLRCIRPAGLRPAGPQACIRPAGLQTCLRPASLQACISKPPLACVSQPLALHPLVANCQPPGPPSLLPRRGLPHLLPRVCLWPRGTRQGLWAAKGWYSLFAWPGV